ncbi:MAG: tetratricopeptide repeat protein [Planctomycetota bacterium]
MRCFHGKGLPRDWAAALMWYRRAARQGQRNARFNLGLMHKYGDGVAKSWPKALAYFRRAAASGHVGSAQQLARFYNGAEGHRVRDALAAVDLGDTWAMHLLGLCHRDGEGVRKNLRRARALWTKAAAGGVKRAAKQLALHPPGRRRRSSR